MSKIRNKIRTKQLSQGNISTSNIKEAFRNEDGAIDLASIMVGIIVIGLIGGVIAATVFAVIPWSQDNAAKHQIDSIHSAQNAHFGLVSDPSRTLLAGEERNSFTNSAILASSSLLTAGDTFCTVATDDGKDYTAYSKSSSGKIFISKNSDKKVVPFVGEITGDCSFIADGSTSELSVPELEVPIVPEASVGYKVVDYWNFETDVVGKTHVDWRRYESNPISIVTATSGYNGSKGISSTITDTYNDVATLYTTKNILKNDVNYMVTAWVKVNYGTTVVSVANEWSPSQDATRPGVAIVKVNQYGGIDKWTKMTFKFKGTGIGPLFISAHSPMGVKTVMEVDDILLEERI